MSARAKKRIRPLLIDGPLILKAELEEGPESDANDVGLTIFDQHGMHGIVLDLGEVGRLRRFLEAVEARGRAR